MHGCTFTDFNRVYIQGESGTEDSDNQIAPLGVAQESLTGATQKRDMKTIVEKMGLTSVSAAQADWQFNGITALNSQ